MVGSGLEEKVFSILDKFSFPKKSKIAVAVSGGGDSMALSLLMAEWVEENAHKIMAITVDHNLRKGSAEEAKQVEKWLKKRGLSHKILTNKIKAPENGLMNFARQRRYQLITEWAKKNKVKYLFTAHNLEDQAETFLMRLERGSGVDGLAAISEISNLKGIKIIRPLLGIKRSELRQYLTEKKQNWLEDPTNQNLKYKRNKLRSILNELQENDKEILINRLSQTAISMARAKKALAEWTEMEIAKNLVKKDGTLSFDYKNFLELPEEIGLRILKSILAKLGGKKEPPRFESLLPLYKEIISRTLKGKTLAGCKISLKKGKIIFAREKL